MNAGKAGMNIGYYYFVDDDCGLFKISSVHFLKG
jgi:hypothetical protein